jgi:hypothetical protein
VMVMLPLLWANATDCPAINSRSKYFFIIGYN